MKKNIAIDKNYNHIKHSLPGWLDVQVYEVDFKVSNSLSLSLSPRFFRFFLYIMKLFLLFPERKFIFLSFIFHGYCIVYYTRVAVYINIDLNCLHINQGQDGNFWKLLHIYRIIKSIFQGMFCVFLKT